jgi:hypothetical protein
LQEEVCQYIRNTWKKAVVVVAVSPQHPLHNLQHPFPAALSGLSPQHSFYSLTSTLRIMKKKTLRLQDLRVASFVTSSEKDRFQTLKGGGEGLGTSTPYCDCTYGCTWGCPDPSFDPNDCTTRAVKGTYINCIIH